MMRTQQTTIQYATDPIKNCAFTGHRDNLVHVNKRALLTVVENLAKQGCENFYCGLARGFDLLAAEAVLKIKKKGYALRLIACIPCPNQEKYYSAGEQKRYYKILKNASEQITLAPVYTKGCMLARDRYMADQADVLVAYLKKDSGGTAYTVNYFQRKHPLNQIIFL